MMQAESIFAEHHRCADPRPSGVVTMWGGMECLNCGFEIVVAPWLSPLFEREAKEAAK
jgi:hypothetical protein